MVIHRTTYPQVDPRAAGLMTDAIAVVPPHLPVAEAVRLGRRRRARVLVARLRRTWGGVTPATLEHAIGLGLHACAIRCLLWTMPAVGEGTPEVRVRRMLGAARPFALVLGRTGPVGAVLAEPGARRPLPLAVAEYLARLPDAATRILRRGAVLGDQRGWAVVLGGGVVRDLMMGRRLASRVDLDLIVEGDGVALARQLAADLGAGLRERVREHPAFLTATMQLPDGWRVDVTSARRERYRAPGALPAVEAAPIATDLWRRDFSLNALAIRLNADAWGQLVDPTGGLEDLRRRRIRVLHPLAFIEDPTRMFRAVRFAARLDCRLDPTTRHLLVEAARLGAYEALSGDRLRKEIALVVVDAAPETALVHLGRLGVFRLLHARYRFGAAPRERLHDVADRTRRLPLARETTEALYVLALTAHLEADAAAAWVTRLGLPPPSRDALDGARREAPRLLARLERVAGPGEAYAALRRVPEVVVAWALVGARGRETRRRLTRYFRQWRDVRPLVGGEELQALGVEPGPPLGRMLESLSQAQVEGRVRTRAEARAWARAAVHCTPGPTG